MKILRLYKSLLDIAIIEFRVIVESGEIFYSQSNEPWELRLYLCDGSFIDIYYSIKSKYSYHWDRRFVTNEICCKTYGKRMKRLFDIVFSLLGLMLTTPILLILAILIKREDGGPVFYRGVRVGRHGKLFRIFKFRTMVVNAEKIGGSSTADDDPRITKIGKFIRKYKLDELPQLINVLKGEK